MCLSLGLCKHAGVSTKQEIGVAGVAAGFTADYELPDIESGNRTLSFKCYYIFLKWQGRLNMTWYFIFTLLRSLSCNNTTLTMV